jgi:hypothetical protein
LLGLDTFGDVTVDASGKALPYNEVIRNVIVELYGKKVIPLVRELLA